MTTRAETDTTIKEAEPYAPERDERQDERGGSEKTPALFGALEPTVLEGLAARPVPDTKGLMEAVDRARDLRLRQTIALRELMKDGMTKGMDDESLKRLLQKTIDEQRLVATADEATRTFKDQMAAQMSGWCKFKEEATTRTASNKETPDDGLEDAGEDFLPEDVV